MKKDRFIKALDDAPDPEQINHPDHYHPNSIEAIKVIEAWSLNFNLGNVIKYISRAGLKDIDTREQDLKKALWYLKREHEK